MSTAIIPKIIGIVGFPTHGKSTAQRFLTELGVEPRDDGDILRQAVAANFNLSWEDVSTQEGKCKVVPGIDGEPCTIRKLLGDYGKVLEANHGENIIAELAIDKLLDDRQEVGSMTPASFSSVRMSQPSLYKAHGGFILEILDPRKPVESLFDFDEFDRDQVDLLIFNDGTPEDLCWQVFNGVFDYLQPSKEQAWKAARFISSGVRAK